MKYGRCLSANGSSTITRSELGCFAQELAPEYGIAYTGPTRPHVHHFGDDCLRPAPIRIEPFDAGDGLAPNSIVNYGRLYTIEHYYVKVKPYGAVDGRSMHVFIKQWTLIILSPTRDPFRSAFRLPDQQNLQALGFSPFQVKAAMKMLMERRETDICNVISSIARASAKRQFAMEGQAERVVRRCAVCVVDLILAGMDYLNAISYARQIFTNSER